MATKKKAANACQHRAVLPWYGWANDNLGYCSACGATLQRVTVGGGLAYWFEVRPRRGPGAAPAPGPQKHPPRYEQYDLFND